MIVLDPQLGLQSVIDTERRVAAESLVGDVAVLEAEPERSSRRAIRGGGELAGKGLCQRFIALCGRHCGQWRGGSYIGVSIECLEVVVGGVAPITGLHDGDVADLLLNTNGE